MQQKYHDQVFVKNCQPPFVTKYCALPYSSPMVVMNSVTTKHYTVIINKTEDAFLILSLL